MQNNRLVIFIISSGAVLFNVLFWQEQLALNAILFDAFMLGTLFFLYPNALKNKTVLWLLPLHVFSLATVLVQDTFVSQAALLSTLLLIAAFAEYAHRSAWYAGSSLLLNFLLFVAGLSQQLRTGRRKKTRPLPLG